MIENKGGECGKERQERYKRRQLLSKEKSWRFGRHERVSVWDAGRVHVHPRTMWMVVNRRKLRGEQFVRL
jgi:hypothetical protein